MAGLDCVGMEVSCTGRKFSALFPSLDRLGSGGIRSQRVDRYVHSLLSVIPSQDIDQNMADL